MAGGRTTTSRGRQNSALDEAAIGSPSTVFVQAETPASAIVLPVCFLTSPSSPPLRASTTTPVVANWIPHDIRLGTKSLRSSVLFQRKSYSGDTKAISYGLMPSAPATSAWRTFARARTADNASGRWASAERSAACVAAEVTFLWSCLASHRLWIAADCHRSARSTVPLLVVGTPLEGRGFWPELTCTRRAGGNYRVASNRRDMTPASSL